MTAFGSDQAILMRLKGFWREGRPKGFSSSCSVRAVGAVSTFCLLDLLTRTLTFPKTWDRSFVGALSAVRDGNAFQSFGANTEKDASPLAASRDSGREEEATPDPDSSSPSPDPPPPRQVSTSSRNKERLRQVVNRWLEANEEEDDPDQGQTPLDQDQTTPDQGQTAPDETQTAPDQGQTAPDETQTAPDQGQTAPDQGQTAPDQGQTAPDETQTAPDETQTAPDQGQTVPDETQTAPDQGQTAPDEDQTADEPEPQHQGEGSGPLVAWLPQTADGPPRKDLAQVVGNLKVRVKGVRKLRAKAETMDPGQTPQDPNQLPNVPDSPPTKPLAQVMGNLRFRVKGLKKKRVQAPTTSRLDEEKPLGHPSGRRPFPGQTAPDPSQTAQDPSQSAPDPSQTAPDLSQIPEEPDRAPTKDLSRNMRVRGRAPRKKRVKTDTTALTEQEEEKPLGRPSRQNPFRRIKMAWADPKAVITTVAPPNTPEHQDLVIEAEEEGEATAQAEGTGLRPRVNKWLNRRMKEMSTFAARFQCGSCVH
ncbi:unnamed protein product [Gadus morhua 'NCC']